MMRVFISWSGEPSRSVAEALRGWLPRVLQYAKPWLSSSDIDKGSRWFEEIGSELENASFGIICVTGNNMEAAWLNFEAGAISKFVTRARVVPYLFGIQPKELRGPLVNFQGALADEGHTLALVRSINNAAGEHKLDVEQVTEAFQMWWPKLKEALEKASIAKMVVPKERTDSEIVAEILGLVRSQAQSLAAIEKSFVNTATAQRRAALLAGSTAADSDRLAQVLGSKYLREKERETMVRRLAELGFKEMGTLKPEDWVEMPKDDTPGDNADPSASG